MESILEKSPALAKKIAHMQEVAGYLWEKGWAERNSGNITLNITEFVDDNIKNLPAISDKTPLNTRLPHLKGRYFFCKGSNKRMRDLARFPMDNGSFIRIDDDCESYYIIADKLVAPTSEILAHLCIHNHLQSINSDYKVVVHTHPTDLVAMSHNPAYLEKGRLTNLLWSMIPETRAFCPRGLGIVPYQTPGSIELAQETVNELIEHDVVLWEKHGACAIGEDIFEAFDQIDVLSKAAQIYTIAKNMGFEPAGISNEDLLELKTVFNLPG